MQSALNALWERSNQNHLNLDASAMETVRIFELPKHAIQPRFNGFGPQNPVRL